MFALLKRFSVLAFLLFSFNAVVSTSALASHECETSCSLQCQQLINDYDHLVQANRNYCNNGQVDCVLNCVRRYSDGSCREYGPDFCARNATCAPKCMSRYSDGSCRTYDADFCGEGPSTCAKQCLRRYSDGSCREYGEDVCGRNASCVPNCTSRWSDGTCKEYGPDRCVN